MQYVQFGPCSPPLFSTNNASEIYIFSMDVEFRIEIKERSIKLETGATSCKWFVSSCSNSDR